MVVPQDRRLLRVYLTFAPVGTLLATAGILFFTGSWPPWSNKDSVEFTGKLIPLGATCYGAVIWILELVGAVMLIALNQYKKWRRNAEKKVVLNLARSGALILSDLSAKQLRSLGMDEQDLQDLQDLQEKELAQR